LNHMNEPEVIFQDDWILAVNKPSGLAVHRGWARDRFVLVDWVKSITDASTAYPVGRLDRGTSGVVLFALNREAASRFQSVLEGALSTKKYLALVRGTPPESGVIDHPLPRKEGGPRVPALSRYKTLATAQTEPRHLSLVEVIIESGRLHQVRRHLKHINHPVIGDSNYGRTELNRAIRDRYGLGRLALHASSLSFVHPEDGAEIRISAPVPEDLATPLQAMGFSREFWS